MTTISDAAIDELRTQGFTRVDAFLDADELRSLAGPLADEFPTRDQYHAKPERYTHLVETQFTGNLKYPYQSIELNRIAYHPELISAAERFHGTTEVDLYKVELWAKYSGAVDYDQMLHRDYGNHMMVVPRADGRWLQMTTILLLSDVTLEDGPTMVVPADLTRDIPMSVRVAAADQWPGLWDAQVPLTGPAGTLFLYRPDVFHRGSAMTGTGRARFIYMADYKPRGQPWQGKMAWPDTALREPWAEILADMSPRQRELVGIPAPGDEYWCDQTVRDVAGRWPGWDMSPYLDALTAG